MPTLEAPYKVVCALHEGVIADSGSDQGDNIRTALASLTNSQTGLYFPKGRYIVRGHLQLRSGNVLVGHPSGLTHFVNPDRKTSSIDQTVHSAKNILVEGLVLDNITINFTHDSTSVARYNGLRNTASDDPQIWTHGADQIIGNVLWREPGHEGRGIADYGGHGAVISGNLLGSDKPGLPAWVKDPVLDDARTRKLAEQMTQLAAANNAVPGAAQPRGHFTIALHIHGSRGAQITRNDIVMTGTHLNDVGPERQVAKLTNVQDLTLTGNRFAVEGHAATAALPLVIEAPQDTRITANTLERTPLQFVPDPAGKRPTKRTSVTGNGLAGAVVSVTQSVTQSVSDDATLSTTVDDLLFINNRFWSVDPSRCMIDAPIPRQPGRTFGGRGNVRHPGFKPAKTCNLRELAPPPGTAPSAPGLDNRADRVTPPAVRPTQPTQPPSIDGPGISSGDMGNTASPPPVPESKPSLLKRLSHWVQRTVKRIF
ncbi:glycosyl hydrolase family 28-related protein [Mitsuaria sp. 7]|uniref:glycosyl hydrolase family 28-related protein n=1 Tax=Mitsuaria sp. 7 TaxID=1658665 RepID=UPI0007DD3B2C|nr:glycosyl hydrolase family 28-related protein [Mitsuaria sp. 7]ANH69498.1 hypothetical protein ABE85_21455 [Mitsuaria sp. 7]